MSLSSTPSPPEEICPARQEKATVLETRQTPGHQRGRAITTTWWQCSLCHGWHILKIEPGEARE